MTEHVNEHGDDSLRYTYTGQHISLLHLKHIFTAQVHMYIQCMRNISHVK